MNFWFLILFAALIAGQLGAFTVSPGVTFYLHDVAVVALLTAGFFILFNKKRFIQPRLYRQMNAFAIVASISLLFAFARFEPQEVGIASLYWVRWVLYAFVYVLIVQTARMSAFLFRGLYATGSIFSLLGIVQFFLYPNLRNLEYLGWDPHYYRLFSTFLDPNFAGLFITLTILLGFAKRDWVKAQLYLQAINIVALYLTYSRGSYLAFLAAGIVWIVLGRRWNMLGFVAGAVFLILVIPRPGGDTLRLLRLDSTIARVVNWRASATLIAQSPVYGHGFNSLRFVRGDFVSKAGAGVDNSTLFLLATTGVAGFAAYAWLLCETRGITRPGHWAIMTAVIVHSQFINSLFYPWIMLWLWIYWGASETIDDR